MNHLSVFSEYRAYLFAIAQRILGNAIDVEDLLQETFLRWQQTPLAQIRSPKAFLSTVIKRLCLNHLDSAYVRHTTGDIESLEPATVCETTAMDQVVPALRVLFERLAPKERLVLILREVFDYEYEEIALLLEKSASNCRQLLRRARQHLIDGKSRFNVSQEQLQHLAHQFAASLRGGDLQPLVAALS